MERNHQQALRIVWILIALIAIGALAIAIAAIAGAGSDDGEASDAVEVRDQRAEEGKGKGPGPSDERSDETGKKEAGKDPEPAESRAPSVPSTPAAPVSTSPVTTFACKADVGEDAPGCGTVYDSGGLRVEANCSASGLAALATVPHAVMTAEIMDSEGESFGSITDSTVNRGFDLASDDNPASSGTVTFTPPGSSKVTVIDFSATYSPGAPQGDCVFVGKITEL